MMNYDELFSSVRLHGAHKAAAHMPQASLCAWGAYSYVAVVGPGSWVHPRIKLALAIVH